MPLGSRKTIPVFMSPSVSLKEPVMGSRDSLGRVLIRHFVEPSGSTVRILSISSPAAEVNLSKTVPNMRKTLLFVPCLIFNFFVEGFPKETWLGEQTSQSHVF